MLRFEDLGVRGVTNLAFRLTPEAGLFWMEILAGAILPAVLLALPRVRNSAGGLFFSAVLAILGFVTNRLNVSLTGMHADALGYFPKWTEIAVTLFLLAAGFAAFRAAVMYLPIFVDDHNEAGAQT